MRYFRILKQFIVSNFVRETEFRFNFFFWLGVELFWVAVQMWLVSFYFKYTSSIAGWSEYQVYFLIGFYRLIEGLFHIFVHPNLLYLPENVNRGDFDFTLIRPVNSLFASSFRYTSFDEIGTSISGLAILIYSYSHLGLPVSLPAILYVMALCLLGLLMFYSFVLFFSTLSFYFTRMTALGSIYDVTAKALRVPGEALTGGNSLASSLLLPFLTIVTIPSQLILGKVSSSAFFLEIFVVFAFFVLVVKFWSFSIRHYSSASS